VLAWAKGALLHLRYIEAMFDKIIILNTYVGRVCHRNLSLRGDAAATSLRHMPALMIWIHSQPSISISISQLPKEKMILIQKLLAMVEELPH